jgi:predicted transcriptional regulator
MSNYKYTPEIESRLREAVAGGVTDEIVKSLADELQFPTRSVSAKLRSLGFDVPKKVEAPKFSAEETEAFKSFLVSNSGKLTSEEIAQQFGNGKFTARQVMGKALALELIPHIKKAEKKEKPKTYTAAEEEKIRTLQAQGKYLEEIAEALGKTPNSMRGKLLSMELKAPQKNKKAPSEGGTYPDLEKLAPTMTVAELEAHYVGKTVRGIKTALSRRGIAAKDYEPKKAE